MYTRSQWINAMRDAVAQRGEDFVYPDEWKDEDGTCKYIHENEPACIVGVAASMLGVTNDELSRLNYWKVRDLACELGVPDKITLDALQVAQTFQDTGNNWGLALRRFETVMNEAIYTY